MRRQLGKVGAIRRDIEGDACPVCRGQVYQLILQPHALLNRHRLVARCRTCLQATPINPRTLPIIWV
jgi:hypothetical protein